MLKILILLIFTAKAQDQILDAIQSQEGLADNPSLRSRLDRSLQIPQVGRVAFRAPLPHNKGDIIILFHGIYGGVSHRILTNELDYLDRRGFRVYIMDLPGVGKSSKPRIMYSIRQLDNFVEGFLKFVVKKNAHLVCQGLTCASVLKVAGDNPKFILSITALYPTGVKNYNSPPPTQATSAYLQLFQSQDTNFWFKLLDPTNIRRVYIPEEDSDNQRIDFLIKRQIIQRPNIDQRWLSLAFIFGQIYRPFQEATENLNHVPVQVIGLRDPDDFDYGGGGQNSFQSETVEGFRKIRPLFSYLEKTGSTREVAKFFSIELAKDIERFVLRADPIFP